MGSSVADICAPRCGATQNHRARRGRLFLLLIIALWGCEEGSSPSPAPAPTSAGVKDQDGDFLSDAEEGDGAVDSDGDGVPDHLDLDSDGDGILDHVEAGDSDLSTPPRDSDGDGVGDWRDEDSDDDGASDEDEHRAARSDGGDSDGDGVPDHLDLDSDDDGLSDRAERHTHHTDARHRDSDGDGVADIIELHRSADPLDASAVPRDDGDLFFVIPGSGSAFPELGTVKLRTSVQFLDLYFNFDASYSMNEEYRAMRDPETGLSSVIERLTCQPDRDRTPCLKHTDCMKGLVCGPHDLCVQDPVETTCVPDIWTGVGTFGNIDTYTNLLSLQPDAALTARRIPIKGQRSRADGRTGALVGPWAEAPFQAPVCVVDGEQCENEAIHCSERGLGCPGFRERAVRVYVQISDADDQCADPYDSATGSVGKRHYPSTFFGMGRCALFSARAAGRALAMFQIRFIGLYGRSLCDFNDDTCDDFPQSAYNEWARERAPERPLLALHTTKSVAESIARAAGSVDGAGNVFAYEALDADVVERTVTAVKKIIQHSPLRVQAFVSDVEQSAEEQVNAAGFIKHIAINRADAGCSAEPATDTNGDAYDDAFPRLRPGRLACWNLYPGGLVEGVEASEALQVFKARFTIYGDGSPLDRRDVTILVPAKLRADR